VDLRITPEPDDRDAVVAAVEALLARDELPPAYRSAWWALGVRENVGADELQGETGLPRITPGATRA
jgi:hypothetical protein